jgi:hypothetical protein
MRKLKRQLNRARLRALAARRLRRVTVAELLGAHSR